MSDTEAGTNETPGSPYPPGTYNNPGVNQWLQANPGAAPAPYDINSPPGAPDRNGTPIQAGDHFGQGSSGQSAPGTTGTGGTTPATAEGGISVDDLMLDSQPGSPQYGHLIGIKRTIQVDPTTGKTVYGYENLDLGANDNLGAIAAATGIPVGALQQKIIELKANNARAQQGQYGSLIGQNPDGSWTYYDQTGMLRQTTNVAELANVGIAPSKIADASASAAQTARTNTQAGQFTLESAQIDPKTGQMTYNVTDFTGKITPLSAADLQARMAAGTLPGISQSAVLTAQYHAQDMSFQNATAQQYSPFTGGMYAPPASTTPAPSPPSYAAPYAMPGATPNTTPVQPAPAQQGGMMTTQPFYGAPTDSGGSDQQGTVAGVAPAPSPSGGGGAAQSAGGTPSTMPTDPSRAGGGTTTGANQTGTNQTGSAPASGSAGPSGWASNAYALASNPNLSTANQTNQQVAQQNQAMNNAYDRVSTAYKLANLPASLNDQTRDLNQRLLTQQQAGMSRNTQGTGFGSIQSQQKLAGQY